MKMEQAQDTTNAADAQSRAGEAGANLTDVLAAVGTLPIGTRIKFRKTLTEPACGDHPALLYAREGETGKITRHGAPEGYWVKTDNWPNAFGAAPWEFDVLLEAANDKNEGLAQQVPLD
jgi:hypothetical protein